MNHKSIIRQTFRRFYIPTAIGALILAIMQIVSLIFASLFFGENGSLTIGITMPISIFIEIIAYLFGIGGGTAISAYAGKGDKKSANGAFTTAVLFTLVAGISAGALGIFFADKLMQILGAGENITLNHLEEYIKIIMLGMPIMLLSSVLNTLVRNDNRPITAMTGIIGTAVVNVMLILLFVKFLQYDIRFIAISSVVSHIFASLFYTVHFFSRHSGLKLTRKINFRILADIIKPGFAGAMIFFAQMVLTVYINRVLTETGGYSGIAVYCIIKYILTFVYAVYDGVNHSAQPMFSVYFGEKDRRSILYTAKNALITIILESIAIIAILFSFAPYISGFFGTNVNTAVYIIAISCLFSPITAFFNSYYRSVGKESMSVLLLILNNLIFPVFFIQLFVSSLTMYINGVWIALLVSEALTLLLAILIPTIFLHGRGVFSLSFEQKSKAVYDVIINPREADVLSLNADIEEFCEKNGIDAKKQYYIFLCIEEIVVNIINHGITKGKGHYINIRITAGDRINLSIRDDAVKYDPTLKADISAKASVENRDADNLGVFLVKQIAEEFSYKRVIGFNSLYVSLGTLK